MIDAKKMKEWKKERNAVIRSYNVKSYKIFYEKWHRLGMYTMKLPRDLSIEIAMRKIMYQLNDATEAEREEAKEWLTTRGYKAIR